MALSDLQTALQNVQVAISTYSTDLATEALNPKASYSINGKSVDWNGYRNSITATIQTLTEAQVALIKTINAQSPYVIATKVTVI